MVSTFLSAMAAAMGGGVKGSKKNKEDQEKKWVVLRAVKRAIYSAIEWSLTKE
jgi:hypothetical protein